MKICKLVNQDLTAYKGFQWELGKKEVIATEGGELCSNQFFHYYSDPLLAVLLNPIHANIQNPRLFLVESAGETRSDNGLKLGSKELMLTQEIDLPEISLNQKVAFGILCVLEVNKDPGFVLWATNWLNGSDRSKESALGAAWAADADALAARATARAAARAAAAAAWWAADAWGAADAAAWAAADAAADAARADALVVNAAAWAADAAARAADALAADADALAADAARAADAAARAAAANAVASADIDLIALANKALTYS